MDFTIKKRIALSIGLLLFITINVGTISILQMHQLLKKLSIVSQDERAESEAAYRLEIFTSEMSSSILSYLNHQNPGEIERFRESQQGFLQALDTYRLNRDTEEEEEFNIESDFEKKLQSNYAALAQAAEKMINLEMLCATSSLTLENKSEELDNYLDHRIQAILISATTDPPENVFRKRDLTLEFEIHLHSVRKNMENYLQTHDSQFLKMMTDRQADCKNYLKQYSALIVDSECKRNFEKLKLLFEEHGELTDVVVDNHDKQLHYLDTFLRQCITLKTFIQNRIQANTKQEIIDENEEAITLAKHTEIGILSLVLFALALGLVSSHKLTSMLAKRTKHLLKGIEKILDGDLTIRLPVGPKDELGVLSDSFNTMTAQLEEAMATEQAFRSKLEVVVTERTKKLKEEINRRKIAEIKRQETEQKLRQSEKMEIVGQLAGGVAHDFNNYLQVILGHAELARELLDGHETISDLEKITETTKKARDLTQQLLIFSRRQSMQTSAVNINELTEDSLKMLIQLIGEHIEVDFIYGPKLRAVHGDRGQIQQILMNLAINARDAMPDGGKLTIKTENIAITKQRAAAHNGMKAGRFVLLSIKDTGCGIDQETLKHVFEPFFTTKSVGEGTGLGLATVFGIVKSHNGFIQAHSEVGKGTSFKIYFPAVEHRSEPLKKSASKTPAFDGSETILLAEDEDEVRLLAERVLKSAGYTVLTATNGMEAVELFKEHTDEIKILLLDVIMPKLGGKEVYEQIAQIRPGIPTLFCSGYIPDNTQINFNRETGTELIQKPYTAITLLKKIREALSRN